MPRLNLTDLTIKSLPIPTTGQTTYWDARMPGFGCRVSQGGQKTFVVMYGPRNARRRKVVGKHPMQSLKFAREEAKRQLAGIVLGYRERPVLTVSFKEAKKQFLDAAAKRNKPRTIADYTRLLNKHFSFGNRRLSEINGHDLRRSLARLDRTPTEHLHAFAVIRCMFNWAYKEELIDQNPADRLQRPTTPPTRDRVLSETEVRKVYCKARAYPWPYGPIITLCLLTGQRRNEIVNLRRDWINQAERTITLPTEVVKNGRVHMFPYADLTATVLEDIPDTGDVLFPGRNRTNSVFNGWSKCKKRFDATLNNMESYRLHDLRRTFSTMHAQIGTPIHVTERLINHVSGSISGVTAVYNRHSYLPEMKQAAVNYEGNLDKLISNSPISTR